MTLKPASSEFAGAEFNDKRLTARLGLLADQLAARSDAGLPVALDSEAALEGGYRFVNNPRVEPLKILAPHFAETLKRVGANGRALVVYDTSHFNFDGRGFGPLRGQGSGEGFYLHLALALADADSREPLGVLGAGTFERKARPKGQHKSKAERAHDNESDYWKLLFADVHQRLGAVPAVHVMDREADCYDLFVGISGQSDFVIRAAYERNVFADDAKQKVRAAIASVETVLFREVSVAGRGEDGWNRKTHQPPREPRKAQLGIRARQVVLPRPHGSNGGGPSELPVNVVQVVELAPPEGEAPIEWLLYTTLPIGNVGEVTAVVDIYRARWVIEEYFKAIKTGCAYETRQLESPPALLNMLAITIPIAWRILLLRHLARAEPDAPASKALPESQLAVLAAIDPKLPSNPTVRDALMAVARRGGHLKRNGEPGWLVLTRGYRDLLILELGWLAARREK